MEWKMSRGKTIEFGQDDTTRKHKQKTARFLQGSWLFLGAWGAWGGGTDGTNGTYRLLLTMGLKMPCAAPRGPCNGRSRRQKSGSYIICAGLLCATASLPFFTAVSFSAPRRALGNIGSSGHRPRCRSIHHCFSLPVCHARRPVLCSSFVPCGFSTPSTTTPTTPPRRVHLHLYLQ